MQPNKKFKSSVFSLLSSDPDLLRELYCALGGVSLPHDVPVTINTLEDVLFMNFILKSPVLSLCAKNRHKNRISIRVAV